MVLIGEPRMFAGRQGAQSTSEPSSHLCGPQGTCPLGTPPTSLFFWGSHVCSLSHTVLICKWAPISYLLHVVTVIIFTVYFRHILCTKCDLFIPGQNGTARTSLPCSSHWGNHQNPGPPGRSPSCQLARRQKHHLQVQMLSSSKSGTNPTGVLIEAITDSRRQHAGWEQESAAVVSFDKVIITRAFAL